MYVCLCDACMCSCVSVYVCAFVLECTCACARMFTCVDGVIGRLADAQRANQSMATFNRYSTKQFAQMSTSFGEATATLRQLKQELDDATRRIRALQARVVRLRPEARVAYPFAHEDE